GPSGPALSALRRAVGSAAARGWPAEAGTVVSRLALVRCRHCGAVGVGRGAGSAPRRRGRWCRDRPSRDVGIAALWGRGAGWPRGGRDGGVATGPRAMSALRRCGSGPGRGVGAAEAGTVVSRPALARGRQRRAVGRHRARRCSLTAGMASAQGTVMHLCCPADSGFGRCARVCALLGSDLLQRCNGGLPTRGADRWSRFASLLRAQKSVVVQGIQSFSPQWTVVRSC
ncbi:MAG: hypothetical protein QOI78_7517, partial [Actinomycetota bacterium]|nr:hypothetical protein [Actinomycetota bacterium]